MSFFRKSKPAPRLSIVVIFYSMPRQALNTLYSLSSHYQQQVSSDDYEIIAVENHSQNNIDENQLNTLAGNFRYFLRDESMPTPVNAINFGVEQAHADQLCIMVDGARLVTPGLVHYMLKAQSIYSNPVVSVPGYHLGEELQQDAVLNDYSEAKEIEMLESIAWKQDGYRLFEIACLSGTSQPGFFKPIGESNTLGVGRKTFDKAGGFDKRFTETGGGQCNLDFYKRIVEFPETELVMLFGEGSFHQYHGGITTGKQTGNARDEMMERHFAQYRAIRGEPYSPPQKDAIYLGELPAPVMKFVHYSAQSARRSRGELATPDTQGEL